MSGNTNTTMTAAMSAKKGKDTKNHGNQPAQAAYNATEAGANGRWYDKIKSFLPENEDIPAETVREIEEEDMPARAKIAALVNIIGKNNRHILEQKDALAKVTTNGESLLLQVEAQSEQIGYLEEQRKQQEREFDSLRQSMEEFKRQLAAKENFLQSAENSNRRLSEDLTEKTSTLGTTGKDKKSLAKLAKGQKKEISKLEEEVEHLKKEVATKGGLVEKYEGERGRWAKELVQQQGPVFKENRDLKDRVAFLEGELASSDQRALTTGSETPSSHGETLQRSRSSNLEDKPSALADEIKEEEFGGEWKEEVGAIDFQPPGWDRVSAIATIGGMAKGMPNPDRPASLHQPSGPFPSTFWSEGVATQNGFSIPKALSPVSAGDKVAVATGRLDACVQTDAAGPTVSSSTQTVGLEVLEASVQTEDGESGPSGDGEKAPVQTGETTVSPEAEWQGRLWPLVIMMLIWAVVMLWGHKEDRGLWLEANGVSHDILVELRDSTFGAIPWLQMVSYDLIVWLQPDRVFLG